MNRSYKELALWIKIVMIILISVSTTIAINYNHYENSEINTNSETNENSEDPTIFNFGYWGLVLFSIVTITIISKAVIKLTEFFLTKSVNLRKYIFGKYFIEGYWIESTHRRDNPDKMISYAIIKFSYLNLNIAISGDAYKDNFQYVGCFKSTIVKCNNLRLRYAYKGSHSVAQRFDVNGHGEFVFSEAENNPIRFIGFFQDTEAYTDAIYIRGEKIVNSKILERINERKLRVDLLKYYSAKGSIEGFTVEPESENKRISGDLENKLDRKSLKERVAKGELELVLRTLGEIYEHNEIFFNIARLNEIKVNTRLGVLDMDSRQRQIGKVTIALLDLIDYLLPCD